MKILHMCLNIYIYYTLLYATKDLAGSNHLAGVVIGRDAKETQVEEWDLMKNSI